MKQAIPALALALLVLSPASSAQDTQASVVADDMAIDIEALVRRLAQDLGREFIIDPRARSVRGATTSEDIDYDSLLGLLRVNGLVAIETADQILITPEANSRSMPTPILQGDDSRVSDHSVVTRVIDIPVFQQPARQVASAEADATSPLAITNPSSAAQFVPILRPMMSQSAMLGAIPGTNQLVMVDRYDNVRRITAIIEEILDSLDD